MGFTIGAICAVLFTVLIVQIGKARELASIVRNDPSEQDEINNFHAGLGMVFLVTFLVVCVVSFVYYIPTSLGWGPNTAASAHGPEVDNLFNITLYVCFVVFVLTHIALFWYMWKFRGKRGKIGKYWAHNETLEMVWMIVPSIVMTALVIGGLRAWNEIMLDFPEDEGYYSVNLPDPENEKEFIEIEATGSQFEWFIRYPGRDGKLGTKYFTQINSTNQLGQTWTDEKNMDDFIADKIVLPVNRKVRVRITSRDVLHNFYIRDMRVKMDAVPGMPTYFIFTPTVTSDSMRRRLSMEPEWQVPSSDDPEKQRWEQYRYELACAELCGYGHYGMHKIVEIVEEDEYLEWLDEQEGGSLVESTDTLSGETKMVFETGTAKSKYFSYFKTNTDETDPLDGKEENFEHLVENKLMVKDFISKTEEMMASVEEGSEKYNEFESALKSMKELWKKAVLYTVPQVHESFENMHAVEKIYQSLTAAKMETPATVSES